MSKEKAIDVVDDDGNVILSAERQLLFAEQLELYVDTINDLVVIEGRNNEVVQDAITKIKKKVIKNIRKGKPEKVFDYEALKEHNYDTFR